MYKTHDNKQHKGKQRKYNCDTYLTEIKECKGEKEELTFFSFSLFFSQRELIVLILKEIES